MTQSEKSVVPPKSSTIEENIYAHINVYVFMYVCICVYIYILMSSFIIVIVPYVVVGLGACCHDKHHGQKQLGKERVYFILQFIVYHEGTIVRKLELETVAKVMDVCNLQICFPWLSQPVFLHK